MALLPALLLSACAAVSRSGFPDVSGTWRLTAANDMRFSLVLVQNGAVLSGRILRTDGDDPVDSVVGRIGTDGAIEFSGGRTNEDFQGKAGGGSNPRRMKGVFQGRVPWSAERLGPD